MRRQLHGPRMVDFIPREFADLIVHEFNERDSVTVIGGEFNHVCVASFEDMNYRAHITRNQAIFGQVHIQSDTIQFSDHQAKDTR